MKSAYLGLDCSGETYSAGLYAPPRVALEVNGQEPRSALRDLPRTVSFLLRSRGYQVSDLAGIGATQGPGSFTGVRLGATLAKTIGMVAAVPVFGWDTLALIADRVLTRSGVAAVALDARRGEVYSAVFERHKPQATLECKLPTATRSPREFAEFLSQLEELNWALGSGFLAYPELMESTSSVCTALSEGPLSIPSGLHLARLTEQRLRENSDQSGLDQYHLDYHRGADVQVDQGRRP